MCEIGLELSLEELLVLLNEFDPEVSSRRVFCTHAWPAFNSEIDITGSKGRDILRVSWDLGYTGSILIWLFWVVSVDTFC